MRASAITLVITVLSASAALGQTADQVFHFANTDTPQGFQDLLNTVRAIAEISDVSVDSASKDLSVHGTAEQLSLAAWLVQELDRPALASDTDVHEYRISDPGSPVIRVFHPAHTSTPQGMQEIVNSIRSIADAQRVIYCVAPRALVVRAAPGQIAVAEWLLNLLDKPAGDSERHEYHFMGGLVRVFFLMRTATAQALQDAVADIRSTGIQRVTSVSGPKALALRGTESEVAEIERLLAAR